jgi:hypothetical protein
MGTILSVDENALNPRPRRPSTFCKGVNRLGGLRTDMNESERIELERTLRDNLKRAREELQALLVEVDSAEERIGDFYRKSAKLFYTLQPRTERVVVALSALIPGRELHPWFRKIVGSGTGKRFDAATDNPNWFESARPIVEAFVHAAFFLRTAVKHIDVEPEMVAGFHPGRSVTLYGRDFAALLMLFDIPL